MGTATWQHCTGGLACTGESCAGNQHTGLRGIVCQHLPRLPQHRPLLSTSPSAPATAAVGPFCCQLRGVREHQCQALLPRLKPVPVPGSTQRSGSFGSPSPARLCRDWSCSGAGPSRRLPGLRPGGPHQLPPVPAAGAGLCSVQGSRLLRPSLGAKTHLNTLRSAGRWSPGPERAAPALLAPSLPHTTSLCSGTLGGARGARAKQTLPNAAGHSRGTGRPRAGPWWPLTEMPSQRVAPSARASATQLLKCPRAGTISLGCISLGAGSQLGQEERLAGSPWALPGAAGWQGLAPRPCPWEQSPPRGQLQSRRLGALQRQPGRRQRLLSNQTDPYLGSS